MSGGQVWLEGIDAADISSGADGGSTPTSPIDSSGSAGERDPRRRLRSARVAVVSSPSNSSNGITAPAAPVAAAAEEAAAAEIAAPITSTAHAPSSTAARVGVRKQRGASSSEKAVSGSAAVASPSPSPLPVAAVVGPPPPPPLRIVILRRTKMRRIAEQSSLVHALRAAFHTRAPARARGANARRHHHHHSSSSEGGSADSGGDGTATLLSPSSSSSLDAVVTELRDDALPNQTEVFRIVGGADVLVGAHGAGQANGIVLAPGACVIEVIPRAWHVLVYLRQSALLQVRYANFMVAGDRQHTIHVQVGSVVAAVKACVEARGRAVG